MRASTTTDVTALLAIALGASAGLVLTAGALFVFFAFSAEPAPAPAPVAVLQEPAGAEPYIAERPVRLEPRLVPVRRAPIAGVIEGRPAVLDPVRMSGPEDRRTGWDPPPPPPGVQPRRR